LGYFFQEEKMSNPEQKTPFTNLLQIGVVVKDIEKTMENLSRLGIGPFYSKMPPRTAKSLYRGQPFVAADRVIIKATQLGNVELELIQPLEGGSPHREYLESKGEGIQHLAFAVDDLNDTVEKLTSEGSTILLEGRREDGSGVTYLDLGIAGIIVEMVKHLK
jgi:methylmalonyl-CoA/ethylmalonyl-CoA epimerase